MMSPHQLGEVTARAEISRTPPGLMSGPSCVVSKAPGKGPEVPSSSDISGIPEAPQDGCWGQCRLRNCRKIWRMGAGSPGSVWVLQLWSAESDPRPIARTTQGTTMSVA